MQIRHFLNKTKTLKSLLLIALIITMLVPFSNTPLASAEPILNLKWTGFVAGGGEALVTADVRTDYAGEEVFHAGGPVQPSSTPGRVTCLNGRTGAEIWRRNIVGIGDTATLNMADVDGDGRLEIMVALQHPAGLYILNAEDGSILWRAPGTYNGNPGYFLPIGGRIDGSGVAGDIDGDGNMDVFIGVMAYEEMPETGKLIHYEWSSGTLVERHRVVVWHPCAGGLSLGDTDNDGTFELYMNERDVYFGDGAWGRGLTSFWAENLTKRWDHAEWGASSNIPMLADVDKDGVVDVVSTDLGRGIAVLNSTDGKPLKGAGGVTLYSANTGIRAHYQSTIYDIDGDGNLEILTADGQEGGDNQVYIWDLYNWQLDATIPNSISFRGPSVGEVSGDSLMDIIVVTFDRETASNNGAVQIYDRNLQLLDSYGGLQHRAIGSVVQDIDRNDNGLNELLVLTQGGKIYAFDTLGRSQESMGNPRSRSEIHFYSESRNGVSEYKPFERPWPDVGSPNIGQGAVNVPTTLSQLSFRLNHPLGQTMNYIVTTYPNIGSASGTNVGNGIRTLSISGLTSATTYLWQINATDQSGHKTSRNYWFTTAPYITNTPPTQNAPVLNSSLGGNTNMENLIAYNQTTADIDGDKVTNIYNWYKNGNSITNLYLPFDTQPSVDDIGSGIYGKTAITRDYSGRGNNGNVSGATWVNGIVGGAYSFDGNDFIRIDEQGTSLNGGGSWSQMTLEFWIKATATGSNERLIWKPDRYSTSTYSYRLDYRYRNSPRQLEFTWYIATPLGTYSVPYILTTGVTEWHHVVTTYKSGVGLKLYIDGVERAVSTSGSGNINATGGSDGSPLLIGYNSGSDFAGILDEVRILPFEISPMQVNQRYLDTKDGASSTSTIVSQELTAGDSWRVQVTPNDGLADGTSRYSNYITVVSGVNLNLPVAGNLTITPASPITTDNLVANYDYYDADGHPEYGSEIRWYKNGIYNMTGVQVPASYTAKGQQWYFTIRPRDGYDYGELVTSPTVTIQNAPPSFTSVVISPDPAQAGNTLTANAYGWADIDGDAESYTYQWQKLISETWQNITGSTSKTLLPSNFASGDTVGVICTAYDNQVYGNTLNDTVFVINSNPPTQGTPILAPSSPRSDDELTARNQTTFDPDGDRVTNIYRWMKGGTSTTNLIMSFETNSSVTAKDYSGYGNNGVVYGATWINNGKVGGAYNFDGNDVITVADSASLGNSGSWSEITVEYWVKPSINQRGARILNKNGGGAGTSGKYMTGFNTNAPSPYNTLFFGVTIGSSYYETYSDTNTVIPTGSWTHVVATYKSGEGIKLYINGVLKSSNPGVSGNIAASIGEPLHIGYASSIGGTANRYLIGQLDEVRIYPTALSATQVFQNFIDSKDGSSSSSTIVPEYTTSGETWRCEVTPNDGWQDGLPAQSNSVTISSANTRPRIDWYSPADTELYVNVGDSVQFMQVSSDPNGSPLTYSWTVDSVFQAATQNWTYTPLSASEHLVRVTVSDGTSTDYQEWLVDVGISQLYNLHVEVSGSGTTNATGDNLYPSGSGVLVKATEDIGWMLSNWLLNGTNVGSANPYLVTMNNNYNLTAVFVPAEYTLTVNKVGSGNVTVNPNQPTYAYGTNVTLTAIANQDWQFTEWSGDASGSTNPMVINMTSNKTVTAIFTSTLPTYTLLVEISGLGNTNPAAGSHQYSQGTMVNISATPSSGWVFNNWLLNGTNIGASTPYSLTMDANYNLTAVFTEIPPTQYQLHVQISGQGTTNATGDTLYNAGTSVTVLAAPSSGWSFSNWLLNGTSVGPTNPYTVYMNNNYNLTAVFTETPSHIFADGFESGNFNAWTGTATTTGGSTAVSTNIVHSGTYSAQFTANSGTGARRAYSYINLNNLPELYARAYIYIPSSLSLSSGQSLWLIQFADATNAVMASYGIRADASGIRWAVQSGNWPYALGSPGPTISGWYLVEAYFTHATTGKTLVLSVDEAEVASLNQNTAGANNVAIARYGIGYYAGTSALTIYVDDVTIDSQATPAVKYALTIGVQGSGSTNPGVGTYQYDAGSVASVAANASVGWQFDGWLLNGTSWGSANPCSLTMNANYSLTAVFTEIPPIQYNLHVQVSGSGSTNATGDALYNSGSSVAVLASASSGWSFSHWLLNGTNIGSVNPYTLIMNNNYNLTAVFGETPPIQYQLHVQVSGLGSTNATGDTLYNTGTAVGILATANSGWSFSNWLLNGTDIGSTNPYSLTMNNNYNVTAVFTEIPPIQYQLHVQISGSGSTNATGDTLYNAGTSVKVLATQASGWTFSTWLLNGTNVGSLNPYALTMDANYNLTAVFTEIPPTQYQLHVQVIGQGTTNATGDNIYDMGTQVSVLSTANTGWSFSNWLLNGTNVGSANPYLVTMNANYNLTVIFTETPPLQYTLHVQVSGLGTTNATGDVQYNAGTFVTVLSSPESGWILGYWLLNGTNVGSTNQYLVSMNSNYNLTAVFIVTPGQRIFADGFESGSFSAWNGTVTTTGGTAIASTSNVYNGTYSGNFSISSGTGARRAYAYVNLNNLTKLYTRAYVYIPSNLLLSSGQSLWLVQFADAGNSVIASFGIRADASGLRWAVQYGNWPYSIGSSLPTAGSWYMVEANFTHATSGKTIILKVNGTEVASLNQDTSTANNVWLARFGIAYYVGGAATSIALDDVAIYSEFVPTVKYDLSVNTQGNGNTSPIVGTYQYDAGTIASVSATPSSGWTFTGWLLNGTDYGLSNPCTLTMNANYNLTAVFSETPIVQYQLHVQTIGQGSTNATGDALYNSGTSVNVLAAVASGWSFSYWLLNGTNVGLTNPYSLIMDNNYNLTAVFTEIQTGYIFADGFESGSFSAWSGTSGSSTVNTNQVYNGTYSAYYSVSAGTGTRRAYSYVNINSSSTVYARAFIYIPSTLTLADGQSLWLIQFADVDNSVMASYGIRADASGPKWAVQYSNWPYAVNSSVPSGGGWYLVEAYFTQAASGPTLVLSVNGVKVVSMEQNTSGADNVAIVRFGIGYYVGTAATAIYIDDVIIDDDVIN